MLTKIVIAHPARRSRDLAIIHSALSRALDRVPEMEVKEGERQVLILFDGAEPSAKTQKAIKDALNRHGMRFSRSDIKLRNTAEAGQDAGEVRLPTRGRPGRTRPDSSSAASAQAK